MLENGVPPERLLERLQALGNTIADSGQGLALIGLGSVGIEVQRLDAWSDLDFFVIARPGSRDLTFKQIAFLHQAHELGQ